MSGCVASSGDACDHAIHPSTASVAECPRKSAARRPAPATPGVLGRGSHLKPIGLLSVTAATESEAAAQVVAQSPGDSEDFTVLFCCTNYDLRKLGNALHAKGYTRVIAAATSRAIGTDGFLDAGLTGFRLPAGRFKVAEAPIEDI